MDKLRAYEILNLQPGSSREEIKEAYAALSKQFHPEEHPDEFQQIHEAYTTLIRGGRRGRGSEEARESRFEETRNAEPVQSGFEETRNAEPVQSRFEETWNAESAQNSFEESAEAAYDFDSVLNKAAQKEAERIHLLSQQALAEFGILLQAEYRSKMKMFKAFFQKEAYADVLKKPEFVGGLAEILADTKLKKAIYDYIIDFYRLRGLNVNELIPEAAVLYRVLDAKRGMNAKKKENAAYAIPAGVAAGLQVGLRNVVRTSETLGTLVLCLLAVIAGVWVYRKLYENHSSIFSQAVIAVFLVVSQFIAVGTEFYGTAFGSVEAGVTIASLLFAGALLWLAVLLVAAVVLKIKSGLSKR